MRKDVIAIDLSRPIEFVVRFEPEPLDEGVTYVEGQGQLNALNRQIDELCLKRQRLEAQLTWTKDQTAFQLGERAGAISCHDYGDDEEPIENIYPTDSEEHRLFEWGRDSYVGGFLAYEREQERKEDQARAAYYEGWM